MGFFSASRKAAKVNIKYSKILSKKMQNTLCHDFDYA